MCAIGMWHSCTIDREVRTAWGSTCCAKHRSARVHNHAYTRVVSFLARRLIWESLAAVTVYMVLKEPAVCMQVIHI